MLKKTHCFQCVILMMGFAFVAIFRYCPHFLKKDINIKPPSRQILTKKQINHTAIITDQ